MSIKLVELTDAHMTRPRVHLPRPGYFYPSEASVRWLDQHGIPRVAGACLRASWMRLTGISGSPADAYSEWIFALGKGVEEILVEQWKQMGIWVANNLKFHDDVHDISGEIDVILSDPANGKLFGAEVKSFYGYHATKEICGSRTQGGRPKDNNLLQALIYVDYCKRHKLLDYFKLIYYARDSAQRTEFDIEIIEDGEVTRPMVNGVIDYRFTIGEIYDRYNDLKGFIERNEMPPRDFELRWGPEKVEKMNSIGEVSKTAYAAWKKSSDKNPIGDWQCNYCSYKHACWKV